MQRPRPARPRPASPRSSRAFIALRVLAAGLLLFVGADHYYEYSVDQYSVLPTIGTLFLLNFISATFVGLFLLAPLQRVFRRYARAAMMAAAAGGFGVSATSLVALLVSEHTPLFGFMESNYRAEIIVAIVSEAAATVCLGVLMFLLARHREQRGSLRPAGRRGPSAQVA
jgi:hypothetical protein